MKKTILLSVLVFASLSVQADEWKLKNINFHMENDADFRTDEAYTYGADIAVLYLLDDASYLHIPFTDYKQKTNYISFSYAQQIYTPEDLERSDLIVDDRPYAGYMYLQAGLYQASNKQLKSLVMQMGLVGPSTGMDKVQDAIHSIIGSPDPQGWDNQLSDEFTFQLNYSDRYYFDMEPLFGLEANLVPEYGVELGNVSTKAYGAALYRFGWNIAHDYGTYAIDNTSYSKIALDLNRAYKEQWGFSFNFALKANAIAQNIFLDGNTIVESHSVDKNNFTASGAFGFSVTYGHWGFDYLHTHSTKEFKEQDSPLGYGSFLLSYSY
jgi:hypothetical protein